ncbi:UNVERIFIED_CONTAM: hypothetical protein K2H54_055638 [Gekko kuhli]
MGTKKRRRRPSSEVLANKAGKQMRMEEFLEEKEEEPILDKEDENILDKNSNQLWSSDRPASMRQSSNQDSTPEQQSQLASEEQLSNNELVEKASKENILFKQTSLIAETLLNLYIKIDEINLKVNRLKEVVELSSLQPQKKQDEQSCLQSNLGKLNLANSENNTDIVYGKPENSTPLLPQGKSENFKPLFPQGAYEQLKSRQEQPSELQKTTLLKDLFEDMETEDPRECLVALTTTTNNTITRCGSCVSPPGNFGEQGQDKIKPANTPALQQEDYEIDSSLLFSVYSSKDLLTIADSKTLAEEFEEVARQSGTSQPEITKQVRIKIPIEATVHRKKNGCIVEEQLVEEIEIDPSSLEEATSGYPKGSQDSGQN